MGARKASLVALLISLSVVRSFCSQANKLSFFNSLIP